MSNARTVARNTVANWLGLGTSVLVLLLITPYVLNRLGDERFGMFDIARRVLQYVSLLTLGLRSVVNRFVSKAVAAGNLGELNDTLSTMAAFHGGVGLLGALVCAGLGMLAPRFFDIQPQYARETSLMFVAIGAGFLMGLIAFNYKAVLIGHQRFDLLNAGEILREASRGLLILAVFSLGFVTLNGLAAAVVMSFVVALVYFVIISHQQQPGLRINPVHAKRSVAKEVIGFGAWNGLIQIGNTAMFATPPLIVAKVLGADQVVYFSIPLLIADQLRNMVASMGNTLAPIAAGTLVTGDRNTFRALLVNGARIGAVLCFPIGAIFLVLSEPFLRLWMGPGYAWIWVVYAVLMISMFGRISQAATLHVLVGGGQIRGLAYIQTVSTVVVIALTIILCRYTTLGVVGAALGVTIPLFLSHTVCLPWYVVQQANMSLWRYYRAVYAGPVASTLPGVGVALLLRWLWEPTSYLMFGVELVAAMTVSGALGWFTCIDRRIRVRVAEGLRLWLWRWTGRDREA